MTDQAGTTRDVLSVELELNGVMFRLSIRPASERRRIYACLKNRHRARLREALGADAVLYVIDAVKGPSEEDRRFEDKLRRRERPNYRGVYCAIWPPQTLKEEENRIFLSALTGSGHGRLKRVLASLAAQANSSEGL